MSYWLKLATRIVTDYPKWIVFTVLLLTIPVAAGISTEMRPVTKGNFPSSDPRVKEDVALQAHFPDQNTAVLVLVCEKSSENEATTTVDMPIFKTECLKKVRKVTASAEDVTGLVGRVNSFTSYPYIRADESGDLVVNNLITEIPVTEVELASLKSLVMGDPLLKGRLVSVSGKATLVWFRIEDSVSQETVHAELEALKSVFEQDSEFKAGIFAMHHLNVSIEKITEAEAQLFIGVAVIAILVFMSATLGWRSAIMILTTIGLSTIWGMGIMGWLGFPQNVLTSALPLLLTAVVSSHGFHLIYRMREEYGSSYSLADITSESMEGVAPSIMHAGITSTVGFATLFIVEIYSVKEFGLYCASGIAAGALLSVVFLPALTLSFAFFQKAVQKDKTKTSVFLERMVKRALLAVRNMAFNKRPTVFTCIALVVLLSMGDIARLEVTSNPPEMFSKGDPVRNGYDLFLEHFGGTGFVQVDISHSSNDVNDPEFLNAVDTYMKRLFKHPGIIFGVSYPERVKRLFGVFASKVDAVPDTREAAEQLSLFDDQEFINDFVTFNKDRVLVNLFIDARDEKIVSSAWEHTGLMVGDPMLQVNRGGEFFVWSVFPKYVVEGKLYSMVSTIILMFILLSWFWMRIRLAGVGIIPICVTTAFVMGLMGFMGISLDIANMSVATVTCCIAIDFGVHYINRVREELRRGSSVEEAVEIALFKGGTPITYDCISNCAFGFLMLSTFVPLWNLGFLMVVSMVSALVATLVILPSLVLQFPLTVGVKVITPRKRAAGVHPVPVTFE